MKASPSRWTPAFTVIELVVMVFTLAMLLVLLFTGVPRVRAQARIQHCINNLKQVGLAFRIWSGDSTDRFPMEETADRGGSSETITNGQVFHTFQVMSNELSFDAKLIVCPSDNRRPSRDFTNGLSNANVSYFVGVDAADIEPNSILTGDRNLTNGPLTVARLRVLMPNSTPGWTEAMHNLVGNIGLSDGSVQNYTTPQVQNIIRLATNRLAFP